MVVGKGSSGKAHHGANSMCPIGSKYETGEKPGRGIFICLECKEGAYYLDSAAKELPKCAYCGGTSWRRETDADIRWA